MEESKTTQNGTFDGNSTTLVGSYVVSVVVDGIADGDILNAPVQFTLRLINAPLANGSIITPSCVFWNYNGSGKAHCMGTYIKHSL